MFQAPKIYKKVEDVVAESNEPSSNFQIIE